MSCTSYYPLSRALPIPLCVWTVAPSFWCHRAIFGVPWTIQPLTCVQFHPPLTPYFSVLFCQSASSFQVKTNEQACFSYMCFTLFPWLLLSFGLLSNAAEGRSVQTLSLVSKFFKNAFFSLFSPNASVLHSHPQCGFITETSWPHASRSVELSLYLTFFSVLLFLFPILRASVDRFCACMYDECLVLLLMGSVPEWQKKNQSFFLFYGEMSILFILDGTQRDLGWEELGLII